jgi:hypothetical protein
MSLSLRSRRKHKAWGASPRGLSIKSIQARAAGESALPPVSQAANICSINLGLAPQALCLRLLRRLINVRYTKALNPVTALPMIRFSILYEPSKE